MLLILKPGALSRCSFGTLGWEVPACADGLSTIEHRPADIISEPLVVQNKLSDRLRQLLALPLALAPAYILFFPFRCSRTRGLDRVGRSTQLVCGDMRHHCGLTGGKCGVPSSSA